ncbi:hypothetical protein [Arenimonas donghaensis]|uniref:Phytase-like domain-containing protein n=1 Tax=Arenimonas donghaensis DSM 18148 = HO3-R19 TaxID=1121014 RepID=A0A087MHS6_9GAMM|nr:hypothetical protein [Arenimonas donghaensis]KFL36429.1 hypothetical protein N788_13100 [Arenimonas donghaensis DSM 18148 = HO3-R19]
MSRTNTARALPATLLALLLSLAPPLQAARWSEPQIDGLVTHPAIDEISGLAAATHFPGHYWAINDSGSSAQLHLVDGAGRYLGSVDTPGVPNRDWEDLASFRFEGGDYLLIADIGDNGGLRTELQLYVLEQPRDLDKPALLAWTIRFTWPDGARDSEAAAVDPVAGDVLMVSKKRVPAELFRVPLRPGREPVVAERLGTLPGIEQPDAQTLAENPVYGRYRSQVTAADLSPNGRVLAVLNYRSVHFLIRPRGGDWRQVLAEGKKMPHLQMPWLPQAEALAFARDGSEIVIGSEQLPSPFLRYRLIR